MSDPYRVNIDVLGILVCRQDRPGTAAAFRPRESAVPAQPRSHSTLGRAGRQVLGEKFVVGLPSLPNNSRSMPIEVDASSTGDHSP